MSLSLLQNKQLVVISELVGALKALTNTNKRSPWLLGLPPLRGVSPCCKR
jgi:hypothetical protein